MRFSSSKIGTRPPQLIVLLQWENSPAASSPCLKFWTIPCPARTEEAPPPPDAIPVPQDRMEEASCTSFGTDVRQNRLQLPPSMIYEDNFDSIILQNLVAGEGRIDAEFLRWGPGMRLTQMSSQDGLFGGTLAAAAGSRFLAAPATMQINEVGRHHDKYFLTAIAKDAQDGSISIKYRATDGGVLGWAPPATDGEAAKVPQEQTLRSVMTAATAESAVALPISGSRVPLHWVRIGVSKSYFALIALGRSSDMSETGTQMSLYTTEVSCVESEAASVRQPDQDLGLRWHVQNITLPDGVANVSPFVINCAESRTYLVLFYSHQGSLHYSYIEYEGSGFFDDHTGPVACLLAPETEEQVEGRKKEVARFSVRSRWSLSSASVSRPAQPDPPAEQKQEKSSGNKRTIPMPSQWCQPGVVQTHEFLWVFYQGADGKGRYAFRRPVRDIKDLEHSWEESSWAAEPLLENAPAGEDKSSPVSRHFIPVVVPGNFMVMR